MPSKGSDILISGQENVSGQENASHFTPQLISIKSLNKDQRVITDRGSLQLKLESIFYDSNDANKDKQYKDSIESHLDIISGYEPQKQSIIYTLYDIIFARNLGTIEEQAVLEIINLPSCFRGLENALKSFGDSTTYPTQTSAPFEFWLNTQVINYVTTVVTKIVEDINEHVFFNAPDPQSEHQKEPVLKYLDEEYNLYSGSYPEDVYNSLTPLAKTFIKESIDRLNETLTTGGILSLRSWVDAIVEQLGHSDTVPCCSIYIYELSKKMDISLEFKKILETLTDQISNGEIKADTYITLSVDKYKPTHNLIEMILKSKLTKSGPNGRGGQTNVQVQQKLNPFCLRSNVPETLIKAAHGTRQEIIDVIKSVSKEKDGYLWDVGYKELFLHIVSCRYKDDSSFLNTIKHTPTRAFYGKWDDLYVAAQNGYSKFINIVLEGF